MGFCTFCGKEVAEGEVCSCQQAAAQTAVPQPEVTAQAYAPQEAVAPKRVKSGEGVIAPIVDYAKATIESPLDAATTYYKTATQKSAITSIVCLAIAYVLTSVFNLLGSALHVLAVAKRAAKPMLKLSGVKYGDFLKLSGTSRADILRASGIKGSTWVQSVFFPIAYMILVGAVVVGLIILVNKLIVKKNKVDFQNVIKFFGAVSLPIATCLCVKFIIGFVHVAGVNNTIFSALSIIALLVALLQAFEIIREIIPDKKQYVCALSIMVVGITIANYLVAGLLLGHFSGYFFAVPHFL